MIRYEEGAVVVASGEFIIFLFFLYTGTPFILPSVIWIVGASVIMGILAFVLNRKKCESVVSADWYDRKAVTVRKKEKHKTYGYDISKSILFPSTFYESYSYREEVVGHKVRFNCHFEDGSTKLLEVNAGSKNFYILLGKCSQAKSIYGSLIRDIDGLSYEDSLTIIREWGEYNPQKLYDIITKK